MKQTTLGGMQWLRRTAGLVGFAAGAAFVAPADAADVCISQKAKDTLSTCPGGKLETNAGKKPQVSFKNAPTAIETKKREDTKKPINPSGTMAAASRDERVARTQARREELLTKEILETDALLRQTKKTDTKDRPKLLRRLAESYVELESAAFRKRTELQTKIEDGKRAKQDTAALEKQLKDADATVNTARSEAISNYTKLKTDFPKFCLSGNTGCGDEVLYYLAYEYEQAGKMEQARDTYQELIKNFKTSPFIPNAYFAFGELYFNLAQQDATNWSFAKAGYEKVIGYPPPQNKLYGYAHYKLGYVFWNTAANNDDYGKAISSFKEVIQFATKYPQLPGATDLANNARRDIIPVYALAGDPVKAHDIFKPLSGDSGAETSRTFKMLDDLGLNYLDTGHYKEGTRPTSRKP